MSSVSTSVSTSGPSDIHLQYKSSPVFDFMDFKEGGENSEDRVDLHLETMEGVIKYQMIPDISERMRVGVQSTTSSWGQWTTVMSL